MMARRAVLGILLLTGIVLVLAPVHAARRTGFENNTGAVAYGLRVQFDKAVTISKVTGPFTDWATQNGGKVIVFLAGEAAAWANVYFSWEPEDAKISSHEWLSEAPALDEVGTAEEQVPETSGPTREPLRIYFVSYDGVNQDIYYMNSDGSGVTRVTDHPADDNHVVMSLDGKLLIFASNRSNYAVYSRELNDHKVTKLTNDKWDSYPYGCKWGSQKIVFVTNRDDNYEVYSMNMDGTEQTNLTRHPSKDFCATGATPDGQWITFTSDRDGNDEIYIMRADGSEQTRLTNNLASDVCPMVSPDGKKIVFTSDRNGNEDIYVMNVDGTEQRPLTSHPADDSTPAWSPDGKTIAFTSARDGNLEIYVMNADGSGVKRLTNSPVHEFWPRYQPKPDEEEE